MERDTLFAVILAGGRGERLWPVSRQRMPKYAIKFAGRKSIIQETLSRLKGLVPSKNILIVTGRDQVKIIRNELKGIKNKNILAEPCSRNTAAAIALAAMHIKRRRPNATMIVLPADHCIKNVGSFQSTVKKAVKVAQDGLLVTLGIKPSSPFTGYGYMKAKKKASYYRIERFIEKPDKKRAEKFLKSKNFFWNSGMFVWKVDTIVDGFRKHMPNLYSLLLKPNKQKSLSKRYRGLKNTSIDYGVMEKARNKAMVPAKFDWTDLGSWLSVECMYGSDKDKNVKKGLNFCFNTKSSVIIGPNSHLVATCGLNDLIVVATKDATLVATKDKTQEIKQLIALIRKKGLKKYI